MLVDWPGGPSSSQPKTGRWQDRRTGKQSSVVLALTLAAAGLVSLVPLLAVSQAQPSPAPANQTRGTPNYLETGRQITGILDRFMSLGYDKRVRPNYGGPPVEVNVTMRILSISSVSEVQMDFTADFYFRQTWHDPRLSFKKLGDIQTLYVGAEVSKKIWLPDTFFGNEKMAYFHEATTPNVFLRIDHSGEVYRSIRLTVTSSCPMNLQYFPMDKQRCTIEAESYGYNVKDIIYKWARKETAVERDKEISLPQFDIVKTVQTYRLEELSSGTYSRLIAEIHFARRMGYYLIQIYIPSSLIVVISWVSFWLHRNASPARVQLGVTTVLTMTTLMSSTNAALPKISYVKSIDIFLGTCFVMVFAALLEYATVGYLGKRIAMRRAQVQHAQTQAQARAFAALQAQGAQGDPVPAVTAGELDHLLAATATGPEPLLSSASLSQTLMASGVTKQLDALQLQSPNEQLLSRLTNPICPLVRATSQSFSAKSAAKRWPSCSNTIGASSRCLHQPNHHHYHDHHDNHHHHNHHHHHHHQTHTHHTHHHPARGDRGGHLEPTFRCQQCCCPDQQLRQACSCQHQTHQGRTCQAQEQPLCRDHLETSFDNARSGGGSPVVGRSATAAGAGSAAAAAAATFVNLHRRNKGLPPSTNPNFMPYARPAQRAGLETIFGVRPSDIDKYSRVVFPVCFVCFQLMYWFVYLHISAFLESEQLQPQAPAAPPISVSTSS